MNKEITPYIYILVIVCFSHGIFAQNFTLKLTSKDSLENIALNQIPFQKKHISKKEVYSEIKAIHELIKKKGFFTSTIENVIHTNQNYIITFSLGIKINKITIITPKNRDSRYLDLNFNSKDSIKVPMEELDDFLKNIISTLDKEGRSFSTVTLENPKFIKNNLFVHLKMNTSKKRSINKTIVKGYQEFPNSFLKNYFRIDSGTIFSKEKLNQISSLTKSLSFVEEKKTPEVLFKKDSTILYLFSNKLKTSSIDAIINFASKENEEGTLLNGNLDLKLNNIFNTGENFELFWNRIAEEKSQFRIKSTLPYLFNSSVSAKFKFDIYRQDSTFLNVKFDLGFDFHLNSKSKLSILYTSENSDYLLNDNNNFDSYSNYFLGFGYHLTLPSLSELYNYRILFNIQPAFGKRTSNLNNNQLKLEFNSTFNLTISPRSYLHIKNTTGFLDSKNLLTNELYRIGGANSIRGFNEQSIFTSKFSYFNLEYRHVLSKLSYLYSISDIGVVKALNSSNESILGLGIGYLFTIKNSQINQAYVLGKNSTNNFNFNNSKLNISLKSFF